ncbi:hypothetical protein [Caulobacter sp. 1776]|uniref:hypothetical protein n=1 Tax=Caulobacter sp. 1776 TaxID=3156420 RepID=UPI0033919D9C
MAAWIQTLIALAALLVLAPLVAWLAVRFGARAKGGLMLASVLLGFGAVLDPPSKHAIEAAEPVKGSPENDEPPLD